MAKKTVLRSSRLLFALGVLLMATPSLAGTIVHLAVSPTTAKTGQVVVATVLGQGELCGIRVNSGDGRSKTLLLPGQAIAQFSYPASGIYYISVQGFPHNGPACEGSVPGVSVKVERPDLVPDVPDHPWPQRPERRPPSPKSEGPPGDHATTPGGIQEREPNTPKVRIQR